ncbi:glycosyltransferase [Agromyces sp. MMS24-K17]|uniref:glycosyltransferase n=1 Tax=Agromyces sp. MMS24-K17 TaxID=3372850 RepID=UPI0037540E36
MASAAGVPAGGVRVLGRVSEEDLAVLYARATAFAMPSLAEGFGLPIVEAFSHGTPVIHSDDPALVEVAGGAGVTVPIGDGGTAYADRLAHAIAAVVDDERARDRLGRLGVERARAFDWRESADRVWALHRELA